LGLLDTNFGGFSIRINTEGTVKDVRVVWMEGENLMMLDQRALPHEIIYYEAKSLDDVCHAIEDMVIRGAPAIGACAALGLAMVTSKGGEPASAAKRLKETRPTANDLFFAVDSVLAGIQEGNDPLAIAQGYVNDIVEECRMIGEAGLKLIEKGARIMTHCNAGALATVDYGTALAPIILAQQRGLSPFVYVSETRPRLQGAKLTFWELKQAGVECKLIVDSASGHFLKKGVVDLVITGADRITSIGDAANKIGTYEKAVLAHENGVPFYIAAPKSTIDFTLEGGDSIPIEERDPDEIFIIEGKPITSLRGGDLAFNPAFDVTPAKYITGFITESGVIKPGDLKREMLD